MKFIKYVVKKGDNLTKIAKAHGYAGKDWRKIYDHPKNAPLRKQRPNPDHIEPKDVIMIPETPGQSIDEEMQKLEVMRAQLMAMPPKIKKLMMEAERAGKEATRMHKAGQVIQADIALLRGKQAMLRAEIQVIDAKTGAAQAEGKKTKITASLKNFQAFQKRQETLAKLINTLKTIDEAQKHMARDPKKAIFAIGAVGADMVKIQKLTDAWLKAHKDALAEIDARVKELKSERKQTV